MAWRSSVCIEYFALNNNKKKNKTKNIQHNEITKSLITIVTQGLFCSRSNNNNNNHCKYFHCVNINVIAIAIKYIALHQSIASWDWIEWMKNDFKN